MNGAIVLITLREFTGHFKSFVNYQFQIYHILELRHSRWPWIIHSKFQMTLFLIIVIIMSMENRTLRNGQSVKNRLGGNNFYQYKFIIHPGQYSIFPHHLIPYTSPYPPRQALISPYPIPPYTLIFQSTTGPPMNPITIIKKYQNGVK